MDFPAVVLLAVGYSEFKFRRLTVPVPQTGTQHTAVSSSPSSKESRCPERSLIDSSFPHSRTGSQQGRVGACEMSKNTHRVLQELGAGRRHGTPQPKFHHLRSLTGKLCVPP